MKKPSKQPAIPIYQSLLLAGVVLVAFAPVVFFVLFWIGGFFCEPELTQECNLGGDILRYLFALLVAAILGLIGIILLIISFFKFYSIKK